MDMMNDFLVMIRDYGAYLGLPIIIAVVTQGLKKQIKFFKSHMGVRFIHFIPMLLGIAGGFLLPEETWRDCILIGGGLGALSMFIYKLITVSLASKARLVKQIAKKALEEDEEE